MFSGMIGIMMTTVCFLVAENMNKANASIVMDMGNKIVCQKNQTGKHTTVIYNPFANIHNHTLWRKVNKTYEYEQFEDKKKADPKICFWFFTNG